MRSVLMTPRRRTDEHLQKHSLQLKDQLITFLSSEAKGQGHCGQLNTFLIITQEFIC